jgi:hypothetical protein
MLMVLLIILCLLVMLSLVTLIKIYDSIDRLLSSHVLNSSRLRETINKTAKNFDN